MLPPQNKFRHFNPRPPWGGRPVRFTNFARIANISIHALRGEGDHTQDFLLSCPQALFQSTPSVGRATQRTHRKNHTKTFQSTPSVGRATILMTEKTFSKIISIHALRGEGDLGTHFQSFDNTLFQSTPSVGRATAKTYKYTTLCLYIVHIKLYIFATAVLFT